MNFPSRHPLNMSLAKDVFRDADLVLCLDTRDWERPTTELVSATREVTSLVPPGAIWIDIGFGDLELSSWALDYQRLRHARLQILADTTSRPALNDP
jgi:acetolactate synthase-1/2/3 large subunit